MRCKDRNTGEPEPFNTNFLTVMVKLPPRYRPEVRKKYKNVNLDGVFINIWTDRNTPQRFLVKNGVWFAYICDEPKFRPAPVPQRVLGLAPAVPPSASSQSREERAEAPGPSVPPSTEVPAGHGVPNDQSEVVREEPQEDRLPAPPEKGALEDEPPIASPLTGKEPVGRSGFVGFDEGCSWT